MAKRRELRKVSGMWKNSKKDGELYFSGKLRSGIKIYLFKNKYKQEGTKQPDYYLLIEEGGKLPGEEMDYEVGEPPTEEELTTPEEFMSDESFPGAEDDPGEEMEEDEVPF